jgi:hypothetical protein
MHSSMYTMNKERKKMVGEGGLAAFSYTNSFFYEARVRSRVRVRYGGTPISKKLGYGYGGVFFYYIFLYIIIHIFLNIYELKNKYG